jgi:hypothetical protein
MTELKNWILVVLLNVILIIKLNIEQNVLPYSEAEKNYPDGYCDDGTKQKQSVNYNKKLEP